MENVKGKETRNIYLLDIEKLRIFQTDGTSENGGVKLI